MLLISKVVIDYSRMHRIMVIPNSSLRRPDRKHDSFSGFGALNARRPKGKAGVSQSVPPMEVKILEDEEEDTKKGRQGSQAATTSGNPISAGTSAPAPSGGGGKRERVRSAPSAMRQFHNKLQRSPKSKPRSTLKAASSNSERALEKDKGGEVQILDVKVNVGYKRPERIRH
uniref:Uncharacterized protein n=1 Tax=Lotharella globosa TaxID=91324 RepID=A0A7S4DDF8_9EUKA